MQTASFSPNQQLRKRDNASRRPKRECFTPVIPAYSPLPEQMGQPVIPFVPQPTTNSPPTGYPDAWEFEDSASRRKFNPGVSIVTPMPVFSTPRTPSCYPHPASPPVAQYAPGVGYPPHTPVAACSPCTPGIVYLPNPPVAPSNMPYTVSCAVYPPGVPMQPVVYGAPLPPPLTPEQAQQMAACMNTPGFNPTMFYR